MAVQVAVCGPGECSEREAEDAVRIGRLLAERGATVVCGGGAGVMAAVAAGARSGGGVAVGVRADDDRDGAPSDLTATLTTNLGQARNAVIVWSADAVIAVGGSWGTLSEIALALRRGGVPVVSLGGWGVTDADGRPVPGILDAGTPEEAVDLALAGIT
ncbi:MAG: TIGR00725 family protein [Actinomycetales bacterium]|nr:TIGR00725 family protein [Actinomycetales bacterium]